MESGLIVRSGYDRNLFKWLVITIFLLVPSMHIHAQQKTSFISGIIKDRSSGLPIEKATVELLADSSGKSISTIISDKSGQFRFADLDTGRYILVISFAGYTPIKRNINLLNAAELGDLVLLQSSKSLKEVVVTAHKTPMSATVDRKVYNVEQDILAASGSASDILKNVPSVEVDIEGQVSLRGAADVTILINGRPSAMMGTNRAEVLQQLPANAIERIEVITNPSAKFRPDGSAGIINIVLKKNVKLGLNGSVNANAGTSNRYNGGATLNYKQGIFSSFITGNIRQDERNRYGTIDRQYLDSSGKISSTYNEYRRSKSRPLSEFINAGIVLTPDAKNEFGINGSYLHRFQTRSDTINREFYGNDGLPTSLFIRTRHAPATDIENNETVYWQHNFAKEDHTLRIEATSSMEKEDERNYYQNAFRYPSTDTTWDNVWVYQVQNDKQLTADYVLPLAGEAQLELGYMGSFLSHDILFYNELYDKGQGEFVMDSLTSSHFLYKENVHAVYGLFKKSYNKFSFSAGLRAEQAYRTSDLITLDSVVKFNYFQLYPTIHLGYKVKNGELQLNYSKRVNRPDGDALNPFPEYIDPLNLSAGNPYLEPEYIHSLELGYQIKAGKYSIVPSLYYRYKYNGFTSVIKQVNDSVLLRTEENLASDQSAGLEVIFSARPFKFFNANLSSNIFYNTINAENLGFSNKKSIFSMNLNANLNFSFTKTTMLQTSINYRSKRQTPQGIIYPSFVVNFGARQDLFKSKLSVTATLSDAFKTLHQKNILSSAELYQVSVNTRDAQVFYFGLIYHFGFTPKKKEEKIQYDDNL
jgi:outer membrane receptor protein involved in Fe transport